MKATIGVLIIGVTGLLGPLTLTTAGDKTEKEPKAGAWRPLFDGKTLAGWKVTNFGGEGEVAVEKGALVLPRGNSMTGVTSTLKDLPKMDYEIEVEAKKIQGNDFFCTTTFPVGDTHCSFVVGGWGGTLCGISSLNSLDASENETAAINDFERDRWYRVRIRVTKDRIQTWIDAKQMVNLKTEDKKITVRAECDPCRPLGIATYNTTGAIREVRIRKLTAE